MVWDGAQEFGFLTDSVGDAETGSLQAMCAGNSWNGERMIYLITVIDIMLSL